jgi:hypothetical protein
METIKDLAKKRKKEYDDAIDGNSKGLGYKETFETELSIKDLKAKKEGLSKAWKKNKDQGTLDQIIAIDKQIMKLEGVFD